MFHKATETKFANIELPVVNKIVNHWQKSDHQINTVRMLVVEALINNLTKSDIAQIIRFKLFSLNISPWDGVATGDAKYNQIYYTLHRINVLLKEGKLEPHVDPLPSSEHSSKTVKVGARGRKVTDPKKLVEQDLYLWCRSKWDNNRHVTRSIMLHQAMHIDPGFLGGIGSTGHFSRLLNWFYFGLKMCYKLLTCKISSVEKKLPNNWRERHDNIIARIAHFQMPQQRPDGTFCPGADDDHVINTDQVPIWWECHSMNQ